MTDPKLDRILEDVRAELERATAQHGAFNSAHEGWAVILEEVDELWEEVRLRRARRSGERMRRECIQIAAMAVRFIRDVADPTIELEDTVP